MTTAADTRAAVDRATEGAPIGRLLDWAGIDVSNIPELAERDRWLDAPDTAALLTRMADTAQKPFCIYHANCADGFGAAWVVRKYFGPAGVDFHPGVYNQPPPDVTGRDVIVVDFSYPRPVLDEMAKTARSILILDHHKSAAEDLAGLPAPGCDWENTLMWVLAMGDAGERKVSALFDMNRSGAGLAWGFFFPCEWPPALLLHIEDRDLWRFELEHTREVTAALFSYPYDFDVWDELVQCAEEIAQGNAALLVEGEAILRKQDKDVRELIASAAHRIELAGHDVPALNCPHFFASEAGHILAKGEAFAACYYDSGTGRHFSLRSVADGLDVAEIARQFGGGGHKHAAGFVWKFAPGVKGRYGAEP